MKLETFFFRAAFRTIRRFKVYSLINVAGLSIGMACCIFIFLWVRDELSFDAFHENAGSIYRVTADYSPAGQPVGYAVVPGPVGPTLSHDVPEVAAFVRFWRDYSMESLTVGHDTVNFNESRFFFTDASVFSVFSFHLIAGDPGTALSEPFSLVITQDMARRYFGAANPVGRRLTVTMDMSHEFTVTGVVQNVPPESHIRFDFLASMASLAEIQGHQLVNWNHASFYTYILLGEGTEEAAVERRLPEFIRKYYDIEESSRINLHLQPLRAIHLHSHLEDELEPNGDIYRVYLFSTIALIVLLIACINYMNLSIAQGAYRAKEVGIRKVMGAFRSQLIGQLLGESLILSCCALFAALVLVEIGLPEFNSLTGKNLALSYRGDISFLAILAALTLACGILSGSYPAFFLSSFSTPSALMQKTFRFHSPAGLRKALVVIQFAASVVFIIATALVYSQLDYLRNRGLGFLKEQVIVLPMREKHMQLNYKPLKEELLTNDHIIAASASSNIPCGPIVSQRREFRPEGTGGDKLIAMSCLFVDEDFLATYGIELVAGKNFSPTQRGTSFILNETAVREIGWTDPIGKHIAHWAPQTGEVIGVVRDFNFMTMHHPIEPLVLYFSPRWFQYLSVRLRPDDMPETLAFIEKEWRQWFPHSPFEYTFLNSEIQEQYRYDQRLGSMLGGFSLLALFIACIGLFGLTSLTIEQRTKEIGIRKVFGATVRDIIMKLFRDFLKLALIANVIAWPVAWAVMRVWQQTFAYRAGLQIELFLAGSVAACAVAILSITYQIVRVAYVNPSQSLRYE